MLKNFDETEITGVAQSISFVLAKPQLKEIYEQTRNLPERTYTYGFFVIEPNVNQIVNIPASFCNNIIPYEYVNEFFKSTNGYQVISLDDISFVHEIGTSFLGKIWNNYAIYSYGYSYHGRLLITGKEQNKGFKALSFPDVIKTILNFDLIAGYYQIEFHQLSPTSYMS